ncbi:MAG: hypothetical protein KDI46_03015 [Alphaproteobacteria bacterium]|nr:hypothetical protein [Alphaproteobacteria bacterium]
MKRILLTVIALFILSAPAHAQDFMEQNKDLDITEQPICTTIRNEATFRIYGGISTDYFVFNDQGDKTRHVSTIRLEAAGSTDPKTGQLTDRADICASGPFYPGRQLDLTLRTLFPVFSCKTRIDKGEIVIKAERKADDSGVDMWAECYNIDGTKTTKPEAIKNTP